MLAPVTNRGDAIGVLELFLTQVTPDVLEQVEEAAHALAYIIVTDRRFTDLYYWGNRTTTVSLAAEIQRQLLPAASSCEAPSSPSPEPWSRLPPSPATPTTTASTTTPCTCPSPTPWATMSTPHSWPPSWSMPRAVPAAPAEDLAEQARQTHQALLDHGQQTFATGQLLRIALDGTGAQLVNAYHPWPLRLRHGVAKAITCEVDHPFGLSVPMPHPYRAQDVDLRPGDRLLMFTDGMLERHGEKVDLLDLLERTRNLHPRETALAMTSAVRDAAAWPT